MRGDTRFYISPGRTVFCGHCDKKDCGRHYKNKDKYPWRHYVGYYWASPEFVGPGCCSYESPEKTKIKVKKHNKMIVAKDKIKALQSKIDELYRYIYAL